MVTKQHYEKLMRKNSDLKAMLEEKEDELDTFKQQLADVREQMDKVVDLLGM
jgi:predicted RNase H-like nuclease (RuvC/YqgF family)